MEKYHLELTRLMAKIACIFAIPAFGAFFVGLFLDRFLGTGRRYIIILLMASFVLSWFLLWRFYMHMKRTERVVEIRAASESGTLRYNEPGVWQSNRKK